jgi:PKD repeat protein
MNRDRLAILAAIFLIISAITGSGAFTSVSAERAVSVSVAGDRAAYLALSPSNAPDGEYARISGGELELVFDGSASNVAGDGLNPDATTGFSNVFNVTNQGTQPVELSIDDGSPQATFSVGDTRIDDESGTVVLEPGETVQVDITLTTGSDGSIESLNSVDIRASAVTEESSGGTGDDSEDTEGDDSNSPGADIQLTGTKAGPSTITTNSTTVQNGQTVAYNLPETDRAEQSEIIVTQLSLSVNETSTIAPTISQRGVPGSGTSLLEVPETRRLTYLSIEHPNISDKAITGATVNVRVGKSRVSGDPSQFSARRFNDGQWQKVNTTFIRETSDEYVYQVRPSGLSWLAFLWDQAEDLGGPKQPSAIESVTVVNRTDVDNDQQYSDFDLLVAANTSLDGFDAVEDRPSEPVLITKLNGKRIQRVETARQSDGQFVVPISLRALEFAQNGSNTVTVELIESDHSDEQEAGVDLVARSSQSVNYEPVKSETGVNKTVLKIIRRSGSYYKKVDKEILAETWWEKSADTAAASAAKQVREGIKTVLPPAPSKASAVKAAAKYGIKYKLGKGASAVFKGITVGKVTLNAVAGGIYAGVAIQKKAVELHLNRPGYTARSYQQLHTDLAALRTNTEELETAFKNEDTARIQSLLQQRQQSLEALHGTLPEYLSGYHRSVVNNAAGGEDLRAYAIIRNDVESLRQQVRTDYQWTTAVLAGEQSRLAGTVEMPTHGWTLSDKAVVYDTLETQDDYTTYRIAVPDSVRNESLTLRATGATAAGFEAEVGTETPLDGQIENGQQFATSADGDSLAYTIDNASADTYYMAVRGDQSTGAYRLTADAPVRIAPLAREGPDIQRPVTSLVEAPESVRLQTGETIRTTNKSNVELSWFVWDDKTAQEDLRYSYRIGSGTGFGDWSSWTAVESDGRITLDPSLDDGIHRVQLRVQDEADRQAVSNVDIAVIQFAPQVALATSGDTSDSVFVRVLPDRRIDRVELEYRRNESDNWTKWKTVDDTAGLDSLEFPKQGTYTVRARAFNLENQSGGWSSTTLVYRPPDTTAPKISLADAPALDNLPEQNVRITGSERVDVSWQIEPRNSPASNVEYRIQVDGEPQGSWQQLPEDGIVGVSETYSSGNHNLSVAVRDGAGNRNTDSVGFKVDTTAPETSLSATGVINGATVNPTVSEPVTRVEVQYRTDGNWQTVDKDVGSRDTISLPTGQFVLRARAVDYAGNVGPWSNNVTVQSFPSESEEWSKDPNREVGDGTGSVDNTVEFNAPDLGEGYRTFIDLTVGSITGELLMDIYVTTRDGRDIKIQSIKFDRRGNETVAADLPPSIENATGLKIRVNNGTAVLDSLRAIRSNPASPPIGVSPRPALVDTNVTLSTTIPEKNEYVSSVDWDVDDDGAYERRGPSVQWRPDSTGNQTVRVRITDVFGTSTTNATSVYVNAPPQPVIQTSEPEPTGSAVILNARNSTDSSGKIETYQWDVDGDDEFERTGANVTAAFDDNGSYSVRLRIVDEWGASRTVNQTVQITNRQPRVSATYSPDTPLVEESVTFDGTSSFDPDGSLTSVGWDFDADGEIEKQGQTVETSFQSGGNQTVRVVITDDDGATNETTLRFYVNAPPNPLIETSAPAPTDAPIELNASESSDPDGEIRAYRWDLNNDSEYEADESATTVSYEDNGTYPVTLAVTDNNGATRRVSRDLSVLNRAPNATGKVRTKTPVVGQPVTFTAAGSSDPDGQVEQWQWQFGSDDMFDASGAVVDATFDEPGRHIARITVIDDDGATDTARVVFHVNAPPNPELTSSGAELTGTQIELSGAESTDPDGDIRTYRWDLNDDGIVDSRGVTANVSYPDDGNYPVTLAVTDNDGTVRRVTTNVTVLNRAPTVTLKRNRTYPLVESPVTLTASGSNDPDGTVTSYTWTVESSGINGTQIYQGAEISHVFDRSGNRTVELSIRDDDGATNTTTRTIHVNTPPKATLHTPETALTLEDVPLNGSDSSDRDGTITDATWSVDNRQLEANGLTTTYSFPDNGTYPVTIRVRDDHNATDTVTRYIEVRNRSPIINATLDAPVPVNRGENVTLSVTTSDIDGNIVKREISALSPGNETRDLQLSDNTVTLSFERAGNWRFEVSARDDDGSWTTVTRSVAVNAKPTAEIRVDNNSNINESVTLRAQTFDEDGYVQNYAWLIDGQEYTGPNVTVTPQDSEPLSVELTVTDESNATTTVDRTVNISSYRRLSAELYTEPTFGGRAIAASVYVDGTDSISEYEWDLNGDGTYETTGSSFQSKLISQPGDYEIGVQATTSDGETATTRETVSIESVPRNLSFDWRANLRASDGAVGQSKVYVTTYGQETEGTANGTTVAALSQANGSLLWSQTVPIESYDITLKDGSVYTTEGGIAKLDPETGDVQWSYESNAWVTEIAGDDGYLIGSQTLTAVGLETGTVGWQSQSNASIDAWSLHIGAESLAYETWDDRIVIRDRDTGDIQWQEFTPAGADLEAVVDQKLLMTADGSVIAHNTTNGAEAWNVTLTQEQYGTIAETQVRNETIYAVADSGDQVRLTALSMDGETKWSRPTTFDYPEVQWTSDSIYLGGSQRVAVFDKATGNRRWVRNLSVQYVSEFQVWGPSVVIGGGNKTIIISRQSGQVAENTTLSDGMLYQGTFLSGRFYISEQGVYAISPSSIETY